MNAGEMLLKSAGKYEVSKTLSAVEGTRALQDHPTRMSNVLPGAMKAIRDAA